MTCKNISMQVLLPTPIPSQTHTQNAQMYAYTPAHTHTPCPPSNFFENEYLNLLISAKKSISNDSPKNGREIGKAAEEMKHGSGFILG